MYTYICAHTHTHKEIPATASLVQLSPHHSPLPCIHSGTDEFQWLKFFPKHWAKVFWVPDSALLHAIYIMAVILLYMCIYKKIYIHTHIYVHMHVLKCTSPMLMVAIIYTKSYTHVPKHFTRHCRNLHVEIRYTFEAPSHKVFLRVAFQLHSLLSIVSVCKPVLGGGVCLHQGKYDKID